MNTYEVRTVEVVERIYTVRAEDEREAEAQAQAWIAGDTHVTMREVNCDIDEVLDVRSIECELEESEVWQRR